MTKADWSAYSDNTGCLGHFTKYKYALEFVKTHNYTEIWHLEDDGRHHPYHPEDYYSGETPPHIAEGKTVKHRKHPKKGPYQTVSYT
jgi:hypothetical protein